MTDPWLEHDLAVAGQKVAASPGASAWVAANAGAGKTKVLIDRVARLLLQGADPDAILCVTYTKAAASEMQARLFERLGAWCVMDAGGLRAELAELEGRNDFTDDEIGRARELFARALETPGGLRIETIHAFCGRVLRRFPLEAGIAPGFQELDDEASGELWDAAFRNLGARVARGQPKLLDAARIVAEAGGSQFSILRELDSHRAAIHAFVRAAGDIEAAVEALRIELGAPEGSVEDLLEQAMGDDLPRLQLEAARSAFMAGTKRDGDQAECIALALSSAPAGERFVAYQRVILKKDGDLKSRGTVFTNGVRDRFPVVVDLFDVEYPQGRETQRLLAVSDAVAAARIFERSSAVLRLCDVVFDDFRLRKTARAGLDFDDLIQTVGKLLTRQHAAEWVLWKLDGGIAHILLDEAQDTSPDQWTILRRLTDDIFAGSGVERKTPRTLFVVGDQKQSIYSFQGADPEHFLREGRAIRDAAQAAETVFKSPHLAMSFRSVGEVLTFVDEVFDPAHFAPGAPFSLQVPVEADHDPHTAFRRHEQGCVDLWPLEPRPAANEPDPWDAPIDQQTAASPQVRLAKRIARFIRREIDEGAAVWERGQRRPARPGDFLILVKRRTGGLFDAVLQALKLANLPVAGADRIQLLDSLPVQDMLNLVRFASCPEDDLTLAEILKGPFGRLRDGDDLNDDDLFDLAYDRTSSLWARLLDSPSPRVSPVRTFLLDVQARRHEPPFELFSHVLECGTGLGRPGWELILSRFGPPAREPVTALVDRAAAFDAGSAPSLDLFLAAIEHHGGEVKRELSGPRNEVRVMTVHGAKGLQAPVVILPDTTSAPKLDKSGLFVTDDGAPVWVGAKGGDTPATRAMRADSDARALREHRRLLYVALTRAQDRLVVCGAWSGLVGGPGRDKDSWYALCEAGMARLVEAGNASVELEDDLDIGRHGMAPSRIGKIGAAVAPIVATPGWLRTPARSEARASRVFTPSSLGGEEPPALAPFGPGREKRLRRGRLIHALFEALPGIAPGLRRTAAESFLKKQTDLDPAQREEMLGAVMGVLEDALFAAVFAPGGRAEAPVIGRLGDLPDGPVINGRVDRLVIAPDQILVVDFKTDRPAPPSVADIGQAYRVQMAAYRAILASAWPERPVRCLLVWTDGPRLMEIPPADLDRALEIALR